MALSGDTITDSSHESVPVQRTGGPAVAQSIENQHPMQVEILPSVMSFLYYRYIMRARWTVDESLIEWNAPVIDTTAVFAGKPLVELEDIVYVRTEVVSGFQGE